jgi:hypothetical protein
MRRLVCLFASLLAACAGEAGPDDEWGLEGPVEPVPAPESKEDGQYHRGLLVATNTTRTQVWTARNKWEDTTTAAARAAGIAWPADSGLTWDEKYSKWIEGMKWIPGIDGYSKTFELTTPWGKTLPSPSLECAEMAMFLRITFAAWYELPLQLEAVSSGTRVYFGHFGVRTASGRFANSPEFAIAYRDHSASTTWRTQWPKDNTLRTRRLWGGEDTQPMIAPGAVFGAYLDEIHLNKRAAYFTAMTINYLGSMNLADTANTYNLVPEAVKAGDVLVQRWQRLGIGHTLIVKDVKEVGASSLDIATISGSMPRRQGKQESGVASKNYFTSAYAGGEGTASDGSPYARLGGGVKRFRVTKNVNGYWTNTWMTADEAHWINSVDFPRIAARPARFQALLGQVSPQQQRTELLAQIEDARRHLRNYPASCAARQRRENAFRALYGLAYDLNTTKSQLDAEHRKLEDYVFGELVYTQSKTCCWNSTTSAMGDLVVKKAEADKAAADARGQCEAPTVFASRTDGYQRWQQYAQSVGRGAEWKAWTEDESCPQRDVAQDTVALTDATPYCSM